MKKQMELITRVHQNDPGYKRKQIRVTREFSRLDKDGSRAAMQRALLALQRAGIDAELRESP